MPPCNEPPAAPERLVLDLEISADDIPRLLRLPAVSTRRDGRAKSVPASIVWHDTADGALADANMSLSRHASGVWRLERLVPNGHMDWLPAWPAPLLAQADTPEGLGQKLPAGLVPVAAFQGRERRLALSTPGLAQLTLLEGALRGVSQDRPACRMILQGEPASMALLAGELTQSLRVQVPRAGLAAQALAVARGGEPAPRHTGAPELPQGLAIGEALAFITAHLADVILHWQARIAPGQGGEAVHQMRVGVRRLRSALGVFRHAVQEEEGAPAWLVALEGEMKTLAALLGAARDWDVFLGETGSEVAAAFAGDKRIAQLLATAERRQLVCYAALAEAFGGSAWTGLQMRLALLPTCRPWAAAPRDLGRKMELYAGQAMTRRLKHVLQAGDTLTALSAHELHALRKQAKRLRYATEFFASLFPPKPVRRYLDRLERLQAVLGAVNDTAVAAGLMAQLGGGADRAFAAGVVQGYGAGRGAASMDRVERAWAKFYRAEPSGIRLPGIRLA